MKTLAAFTIALLAIAGCGGGDSPEDQVRDAARTGMAALTSDHPERACQYMVDRDKCVGAMVLVKGMDVAAMAGVPEDWEDRLENAEVQVDGDKATITDFTGDGKGGTYVRKDGKWLSDNR